MADSKTLFWYCPKCNKLRARIGTQKGEQCSCGSSMNIVIKKEDGSLKTLSLMED